MTTRRQYRPFEQALIEAVRNRPVLYDFGLEDYKNTTVKDKAWKEIQENLGQLGFHVNDIEQLCKRWKSLRDRYIRLKGDASKKLASGSATCVRIKWPHFKTLQFLDGHAKRQLTTAYFLNQDGSTTDSKQVVEAKSEKGIATPFVTDHSYLPVYSTPTQPLSEQDVEVLEILFDNFASFLCDLAANKRMKLKPKRNVEPAATYEPDSTLKHLQFISNSLQQTIKTAVKPLEDSSTEALFGRFVGKSLEGMDVDSKKKKMQEITTILLA